MKAIGFILVVLVVVIFRLIPHPPNFTPVIALGVFGGYAYSNKFISVALVLSSMLISDFWLGYSILTPVVYVCLISNCFMGKWITEWKGMMVASAVGSIVFFLVTNLAVWWMAYEHSTSGFISCYTLALPFFKNTLSSAIIFSSCFYLACALKPEFFSLKLEKHKELLPQCK